MLDAINPWGAQVRPFVATQVSARVVNEAWQWKDYCRLRRRIFCEEQAVFEGSDFDEWDLQALPIVAVSQFAGMPHEVIGVVRIYQQSPGIWYGGRLGVCEQYRRRGAVGGSLIECAVSTAHALGCQRFLATIQLQNVRYFEHYAFRCLKPIEVQGRTHQLMEADLTRYPPRPVPTATQQVLQSLRLDLKLAA